MVGRCRGWSLMSNARSSITEIHSALRSDGCTQAKKSGPCPWRSGDLLSKEKATVRHPVIHWVFAEDIDAFYQELKSLGANIVDPLEKKPWGLRQFTVKDLDSNLFYFHHD